MICKKNVFSYIMWVLYTVLALGGLYVGAMRLCAEMSYPLLSSLTVCCVVLFLGIIAVWGACSLGKKARRLPALQEWQRRLIEGVILAMLLIAGLTLRLGGIAVGVTAGDYFNYAMVGTDQAIPFMSHRIVSTYLYLLHFVLLVFGNKLAAGIWLQMTLQYAGLLLLYAAVRKISGTMPAVTMFFFAMTSPYMAGRAIEISPGELLLFFCGAVLCLVAVFVTETKKRIVFGLVAGLAVGVLTYLDPSGMAVLSVMIVGLWMRRQWEGEKIGNRVLACILSLVAVASGFFLMLYLVPLSIWDDMAPGAFLLPFAGDTVYHPWDIVPLFLSSLGVFSFWCDKKSEKLSIWTLFVLILTGFSLFQMLPETSDPNRWILLSAGILTGVSLSQLSCCFVRQTAVENTPADSPDSASKEEQATAQEAVPKESQMTVQEKEKPVGEPGKVVTVTVRGETKQVKLLDNPLPLPKRREHKPMDFGKKAEDAYDGYDYPVADNDDYDI